MSDMTKPAKDVVLALINTANGKGLTFEEVQFGLPTVATTGTKNTVLTLTAIQGEGYVNSQTFNYNRLHLTTAILTPSGKDATFTLGTAKKISDMIPGLNALLGINLGVDDYVDGDLPTFVGGVANEEHDVQVVAKNDSLGYIGSLTFKLKADDIDLAQYLTVTDLDGLTYIPPAA